MKGYQTPSGSSVSNAYLLGLFTRVCKLLFTNVKPVFVFDGGVPQLKKKTIAARQNQKSKSAQASEKLRQQLLKNLLKQKAVGQVLEEIRGQSSPKKKERDMFELPPLPEAEDSLSEVEEMSYSSSEEDVKPNKLKFRDLHTIDVKSAEFRDLPADMRHEILTELKETRKQNSWGRIHELPEDLGDFSKYQMGRLLKRRSVQVSLEEAEKEMGGRTLSLNDVEALLAEGGVEINPQITKRIASDDVTRYVYVRGTGQLPNSSQEASAVKSSNNKDDTLQGEASSFSTDVKIKEEIIDCDELSDSELLREVEAIEMAHIASNIKKEENVEFGTENMFEDDTSSEGVIIDDMDLIKDTSGLSQEQILAIIRKENQDKTSFVDENMPSTSKEDNNFQEDILKTNYSNELIINDNIVVSTEEKITDLSKTSKNNESKILESLYFKINKKRIKSALFEKSKNINSNNSNKFENINTIKFDKKTDENVQKTIQTSDFSDVPSESETIHKLPCEVSILELPKTTSKLLLKKSSLAEEASCTKALIPTQSNEQEDAPFMSSSESDSEFVEVPVSTGEVLSLNNQGLEIQIQTTQEMIHDDIFADIFAEDTTSRTSVNTEEINESTKSFQIKPLSARDQRSSHTEMKEKVIDQSLALSSLKIPDKLGRSVNNERKEKVKGQSLNLPSLKIPDKLGKTAKNKTNSIIISRQNDTEKSVKDLHKVKHSSQEKTTYVADLPIQTIQANNKKPLSSQVQKQITYRANNKCALVSQVQKPTSIESNREVEVVQQKNFSQGNRKYRQSLYTKKQVDQTNVQLNNNKKKTVQDIFSSIFNDDDSEEETVDDTECHSINKECFEDEELQNQTEMEKESDTESNFETENFESDNNRLDITPSPTIQLSLTNEEKPIYKQSEELFINPTILETNTTNEEILCSSLSTTKEHKVQLNLHKDHESQINLQKGYESYITLQKHHESQINLKKGYRSQINPQKGHQSQINLYKGHESQPKLQGQLNLEGFEDIADFDDPGKTDQSVDRPGYENQINLQKGHESQPNLQKGQLNLEEGFEDSDDFDDPGQTYQSVDRPGYESQINLQKGHEIQPNLQEGQLNTEEGFEDSEDVDDPGHKDQSVDQPVSEGIDQREKPKRILDLRQLEKLQDILETKERELVIDQNREDRLATSLTDQMYQEAQELLRLFGVPFIVAPMEAEAQCAFLDASGLTEGTITDDSDIWLFGGRKVYKNFFDQKKFVLEFLSGDIQQYFKLARSHLVLLALLVGSDYTVGLTGVGPVTALEILSTFPVSRPDSRDAHELLVSLTRFREWCCTRPDTHSALAKKLRNVDVHEGFPSPAVVSAYLNPMVDDSREPFTWGTPDVAALRDYAERKFGWSRSRTDQVLLPAVNKLSQRTSQLTLHTFFGAIPNIPAHREQMSRRVQSAVNRLEGGSEEFTPLEPRPRQPRGRGGSSRGGRGRGRAAPLDADEELPFPGAVSKRPEVIPQREKDKAEATKRKQQAIEVLKNKKQRGIKKRRNVRQVKPQANLSESSSDDN